MLLLADLGVFALTHPSTVDAPILPSVAAGDRAAVRRCIDRWGPLVWSLARRHCDGPAEAEDAVQDIFVELWKSAGRFDPAVGSEATFVATVARRRLIDRHRRRARRPDAAPAAETAEEPRVEARVDGRRALRALEALSPEQRDVVALAACQGFTHGEIAARTRLPLGTVKSHARRGLLKLRDALAGPRAVKEERP